MLTDTKMIIIMIVLVVVVVMIDKGGAVDRWCKTYNVCEEKTHEKN